jgi:hypothetical protein
MTNGLTIGQWGLISLISSRTAKTTGCRHRKRNGPARVAGLKQSGIRKNVVVGRDWRRGRYQRAKHIRNPAVVHLGEAEK